MQPFPTPVQANPTQSYPIAGVCEDLLEPCDEVGYGIAQSTSVACNSTCPTGKATSVSVVSCGDYSTLQIPMQAHSSLVWEEEKAAEEDLLFVSAFLCLSNSSLCWAIPSWRWESSVNANPSTHTSTNCAPCLFYEVCDVWCARMSFSELK